MDAIWRVIRNMLEMKHDLWLLKQDIALVRQELLHDIRLLELRMNNHFALLYRKFDMVELRLTVKLGSMLIAGFVLTIAALRFWT